jgi:uncharacterized protein (DUF58 family)
MPEAAPLSDPTALAKFGRLEVVAKLLVEGDIIGQHKSPFKGASVEFVEHRDYYPGDEIRHIDWRAFGKTGKYYVKEFEDETNLRCCLMVDLSGSMAYGQSTLPKIDYARQLAAAFGYLLTAQRDAVGLITFDTKVRDQLEPGTSPQNFRKLIAALNNGEPGHETSIAGVINRVVPAFKRRSLVVLISDCFDDVDALCESLKRLRHARHEVILMQVVAPEEKEFPFQSPTQFRSLERKQRLLVDPHRLRKIYLKQFAAFQEELSRRCGGMGVDLVQLTTVDPYQKALGAFLDSRSRSRKKR